MAWLEQRGTTYHLVFRFADQRFKKSLRTSDEREASTFLERAKRRLRLVEQGEIELPEDVDLATYILTDGRRQSPVRARQRLSLSQLIEEFNTDLPIGAMEETSLATVLIHLDHVKRILGHRFDVAQLKQSDLQRYVNLRSKEPGRRGKSVSPVTIRKELTSFSGVWTWARSTGLVSDPFPKQGLRYPKTDEKPPFQTWEEIERQIDRGGLTETEQEELWDCLYLTTEQIEAVLKHVHNTSRAQFLHPMLMTAAHTGARRSELLRSMPQDVDLEMKKLVLRERKRVKKMRSLRMVPLSSSLHDVLCEVLNGEVTRRTFTHHDRVVTVNQATDHLKRTLAASRWGKIRGWHVFRHSFISNCAVRGIDQRMIDSWVGHQTDEMRRRYTHLFPNSQQIAMQSVFG